MRYPDDGQVEDDDTLALDEGGDVYDGRDTMEGCVLGADCLHPDPDHLASECFDLEMAQAHEPRPCEVCATTPSPHLLTCAACCRGLCPACFALPTCDHARDGVHREAA
jgi:hypothetical protein